MMLIGVLSLMAMAPRAASSKPANASAEYIRSDGFMHERLTLLTDSGNFVYVELGCVGGPTTYEGKAEVKTDRVSIEGKHGVLERELLAITWGQRRYLVAPNQKARFCAYVSGNVMDEPIPFFLRVEDQAKPVPSRDQQPLQCR
jgi:hypothetical protein